MHGDKRSQIPGIHPPSYEDALRDPTEPPTYALPPPLPMTQPPPMTSSKDEIYDIGGSQIYDVGGEYPTLPKYSTLPREESKPMTHENDSSLYDNHAFGSSSLYDQAGKIDILKIELDQKYFRTSTITAAFTSSKFQSASIVT